MRLFLCLCLLATSTSSGIFSSHSDDSTSSLVGYTLVNLSTLSSVRHRLVDSKLLSKICPLTTVDEKKEMAADILRNLAFEDGELRRIVSNLRGFT